MASPSIFFFLYQSGPTHSRRFAVTALWVRTGGKRNKFLSLDWPITGCNPPRSGAPVRSYWVPVKDSHIVGHALAYDWPIISSFFLFILCDILANQSLRVKANIMCEQRNWKELALWAKRFDWSSSHRKEKEIGTYAGPSIASLGQHSVPLERRKPSNSWANKFLSFFSFGDMAQRIWTVTPFSSSTHISLNPGP